MAEQLPEMLHLMQLEAELKERSEKLFRAATVGKALLEENENLHSRIDDLLKQHSETMEEKQQELSVLHFRLETAQCTERWQHDEISSLRAELQSLQNSITEQLQEKHRQEISSYKKQVEGLRLDLDCQKVTEQELCGQISKLETLLQNHLDRTQIQYLSMSGTSEDISILTERVVSLEMDVTQLQARNIELLGQVQQLGREKEAVGGRLLIAQEELEEAQRQLSAYARHLEEARNEKLELQALLDAAKVNSQVHCFKGNSLFSELEDRRLVLETKMASLKFQYQQLKEKYDIEKQQAHKYKMQFAMALKMTTSGDDGSVQQLSAMLKEAHEQIKALAEQLNNADTPKMSQPKQSTDEVGSGDDKNYVQYLLTILQAEKNKLAKAQSELNAKSLQYLDATKTVSSLVWQRKQLEAERDRLQSQLIIADLEREQLLLKYDPDKIKSGKQATKIVEKIEPDRCSSVPEQGKNAPGIKSRLKKPGVGILDNHNKPREGVSAFAANKKAIASSERLTLQKGKAVTSKEEEEKYLGEESDMWLVSPSVDTLSDKENLFQGPVSVVGMPLQQRKVKMFDDVVSISFDGEESIVKLAGDMDTPALTPEAGRKCETTKATSKVKYVTADACPELECKTQ